MSIVERGGRRRLEKKAASGIMLTLLLTGLLIFAFDIQPVKAWTGTTIYIRADGSVDPPTAPIQRNGDLYTLTGNIFSNGTGIVIQRNNMTLDGASHTVQGMGISGYGIDLSLRVNVTVRDIRTDDFYGIDGEGIHLYYSSNNTISGNNIGWYQGIVLHYSSNNNISGNNIAHHWDGIRLFYSSSNTISGNNITNSGFRFNLYLDYSSFNTISGNNILYSNPISPIIFLTASSSNNKFYHNNIVGNPTQVYSKLSVNVWDDGYPSGGNYWSDYAGPDILRGNYQNLTGGDGIGDKPYVIDANNTDHYPLVHPLGTLNYGFSDNFDDNSTDLSRWIKIEKGNGTASEINGRVEFSVPSASGTGGYITLMSYNLSTAYIRVNVTNQHLAEGALAITLEGPKDHFWYADNFYAIEKHKYSETTKVKKRIGGGEREALYEGGWTGPSGYLRIVIKNGTIHFYEEEYLRYSEPYNLSSYNCYITIEANTWHKNYIGIDHFDNFTFTSQNDWKDTVLDFSLTPNPAYMGQTVTMLGNLTDRLGHPINDTKVDVYVNGGWAGSLFTNSTGWFRASGPVRSIGAFNVTAEYAGSWQYLPSSTSQVLVVNESRTDIFAKFSPNPVDSGETVVLKGILVDQFGEPLRFAVVTLEYSTDYGSTWHPEGAVTTNSYGIFSKTYTASSPRTYLMRLSYAGSTDHDPGTTNISLIVR